MDVELKDKLIGTLMVPVGILILFIPFSLIIGWNLISLLLFWFVLTPLTATLLPFKVLKRKNRLIESITGLLIFYAFIVFMIYDHYKSDYFQVMIVSCALNLLVVTVITLRRRDSRHNV